MCLFLGLLVGCNKPEPSAVKDDGRETSPTPSNTADLSRVAPEGRHEDPTHWCCSLRESA